MPDACLLSLSLVSLEGGGKAKEKHGKSSGRAHANCDTGSAGAAAEGATGKGSQAEATMWPKIQKGRADKRLMTLGGLKKGYKERKEEEKRGRREVERGKGERLTEAAVKKWQSKTNLNGNESQVRARRAALPKDIWQQQQQHQRRTTNRWPFFAAAAGFSKGSSACACQGSGLKGLRVKRASHIMKRNDLFSAPLRALPLLLILIISCGSAFYISHDLGPVGRLCCLCCLRLLP